MQQFDSEFQIEIGCASFELKWIDFRKSLIVADTEMPPKSQFTSPLKSQIASPLKSQIASPLKSQIASPLKSQIASPLKSQIASPLKSQIASPDEMRPYESQE